MDYAVVDNFLAPDQADRIERTLFGQAFPWTYYANTNHGSLDTQAGDTPQFIHGFLRDGASMSTYSQLPIRIIQAFGFSPAQIIRAKANLLPWDKTPGVHPPHTDDPAPHMVFIYYANDADGETCLFDGDEIAARIQPKKGRGLWFDGQIRHASSSPTATRFRSVINFNIRKPVDLEAIRKRWGAPL